MVSFTFYPYMIMPLISLALSILITFRISTKLDSRPRQYFFVTVLILCLWNFGDLIYPGLSDQNLAKVVLNVILVMVSMIPTFFGLSIVSLYRKPKKYEILFLMFSMFIIPIIIVSPFNLRATDFGWQPIYTEDPIFPLWISLIFVSFLYACIYLVRLMSSVHDKKNKKRIRYMLMGALLGVLFGVVTIILSVVLDLTPLPIGSFGLVIFTSFMFLAYFK